MDNPDLYIIPWKYAAIFFGLMGLGIGFMIGWHLRALILARTILKYYFNTDYTKKDNVLYIDKFRGKLK